MLLCAKNKLRYILLFKRLRAWLYFEWQVYKAHIKPYLRPSLAISFFIAWMLTNGWCYLLIAFGHGWLRGIALTYAGILWLPFTPEKLITIPFGFYIQKLLFINGPGRRSPICYYEINETKNIKIGDDISG